MSAIGGRVRPIENQQSSNFAITSTKKEGKVKKSGSYLACGINIGSVGHSNQDRLYQESFTDETGKEILTGSIGDGCGSADGSEHGAKFLTEKFCQLAKFFWKKGDRGLQLLRNIALDLVKAMADYQPREQGTKIVEISKNFLCEELYSTLYGYIADKDCLLVLLAGDGFLGINNYLVNISNPAAYPAKLLCYPASEWGKNLDKAFTFIQIPAQRVKNLILSTDGLVGPIPMDVPDLLENPQDYLLKIAEVSTTLRDLDKKTGYYRDTPMNRGDDTSVLLLANQASDQNSLVSPSEVREFGKLAETKNRELLNGGMNKFVQRIFRNSDPGLLPTQTCCAHFEGVEIYGVDQVGLDKLAQIIERSKQMQLEPKGKLSPQLASLFSGADQVFTDKKQRAKQDNELGPSRKHSDRSRKPGKRVIVTKITSTTEKTPEIVHAIERDEKPAMKMLSVPLLADKPNGFKFQNGNGEENLSTSMSADSKASPQAVNDDAIEKTVEAPSELHLVEAKVDSVTVQTQAAPKSRATNGNGQTDRNGNNHTNKPSKKEYVWTEKGQIKSRKEEFPFEVLCQKPKRGDSHFTGFQQTGLVLRDLWYFIKGYHDRGLRLGNLRPCDLNVQIVYEKKKGERFEKPVKYIFSLQDPRIPAMIKNGQFSQYYGKGKPGQELDGLDEQFIHPDFWHKLVNDDNARIMSDWYCYKVLCTWYQTKHDPFGEGTVIENPKADRRYRMKKKILSDSSKVEIDEHTRKYIRHGLERLNSKVLRFIKRFLDLNKLDESPDFLPKEFDRANILTCQVNKSDKTGTKKKHGSFKRMVNDQGDTLCPLCGKKLIESVEFIASSV